MPASQCFSAAAELGREVRRRRELAGLTLEGLAARAGLSLGYVDSIELGQRDPSLASITALASGLGVAAGELLGGSAQLTPAALEFAELFDRAPLKARGPILELLRAAALQAS